MDNPAVTVSSEPQCRLRQGARAACRVPARLCAVGVGLALLVTYWLTAATSVSYWDCPEYVASAVCLEVGHPPGNPFWMLTHRVATMLVDARHAALAVNLCSGLFMALAGALLTLLVYAGYAFAVGSRRMRTRFHRQLAAAASLTAGLCFGWCDSAWYSAVEAEVYAMSAFLTALMLWTTVLAAAATDRRKAFRLIVLSAYLTGLSLGVHQLNLLVLPAAGAIWWCGHGQGRPLRLLLLVIAGTAATGLILAAVMPGALSLAGAAELCAVNSFGWPPHSGVMAFVALSAVLALAAIILTSRCRPLWPSLLVWCLTMVLAGYSVFAVVMIRGDVLSPTNATVPSDIFSLRSYILREQYGSAPLLRGHTFLSERITRERFTPDGRPDYTRLALRRGPARYAAWMPGATLRRSGSEADPDSDFNARAFSSAAFSGHAYLMRDHAVEPIYTPELDMWIPRMTSRAPAHVADYQQWLGIDTADMVRTPVSTAVDSAGRPVTPLDDAGHRPPRYGYRPTMAQNLRWMAQYQLGYMYFRYLMWNFAGRQNDISSTGEVNHGNFITGFPAVDDAMLGAEEALPPEEGRDNPGRNKYFMLPLLLGLFGAIWLPGSRRLRRGGAVFIVVLLVFIMTGPAITVYLNQSPAEPRERDYAFLGSYMAFAAWCGFGCAASAIWLRSCFRRRVAAWWLAAPALAVPLLMLAVNFDDHDRSHRDVARITALNLLNSLPQDAVIFVDGDNFTFPLWYAQEVEGVRRDVAVVNLSYLSLPAYSEGLRAGWRSRRPLALTLPPGVTAYGAASASRPAPDAAPSMEARRAFEFFSRNPAAGFPARSLRLALPSGDSAIIDLPALMRENGQGVIPLRRLLLLDLVASNPDRPFYWQFSAKTPAFAGLRPYASGDGLAWRLAPTAPETAAWLHAQTPAVDTARKPYLDETPAKQLNFYRASVTAAALRALDRGDTLTARRLATEALRLAPPGRGSLGVVSHADSSFNVSAQLIRLLRAAEQARSLSEEARRQARAAADSLAHRDSLINFNRAIYLKSLPQRLKNKASF